MEDKTEYSRKTESKNNKKLINILFPVIIIFAFVFGYIIHGMIIGIPSPEIIIKNQTVLLEKTCPVCPTLSIPTQKIIKNSAPKIKYYSIDEQEILQEKAKIKLRESKCWNEIVKIIVDEDPRSMNFGIVSEGRWKYEHDKIFSSWITFYLTKENNRLDSEKVKFVVDAEQGVLTCPEKITWLTKNYLPPLK